MVKRRGTLVKNHGIATDGERSFTPLTGDADKARAYAESLIKNAPDPVFVSDLEGKILQANEAVYKLLGFRPDEVIEQSVSRFISPAETREFTAALREVVEKGVTRNVRLNPRSAAGEVIPTALNASALRDSEGRVIGAIGVLRDMREYEQVVRDLEKSKQELQEKILDLEKFEEVVVEREHSIAETLQRSLLPRRLPNIPGITAAARYLPATPEAVGGDWYDLFSLPGGRVGVVMGDVAGRGIQVASLMGQLRNALRAYAGEGYSPSVVLSRLATIIEPTEMATVLFMVFDPSAWKIEYANAGHPPPLVATPDGHASFLEGGSLPLGPALNQTYRDLTTDLIPGSLLMLYTDGLVEDRRTDLNESLQRLKDAVVRSGNGDVEQLADRIVKEIRATNAGSDDTALLILRIAELDPSKFELTLPAIPASLPAIRHALRRWMADARVEVDDAYEVLVASCEACSNVIEHAYGLANGDVEVHATMDKDVIGVIVRDHGTWTPTRGVHRGRGLHMIEALMEDVEIRQTEQGTMVRMRYRRRGSRNDVDRANQGAGSQGRPRRVTRRGN